MLILSILLGYENSRFIDNSGLIDFMVKNIITLIVLLLITACNPTSFKNLIFQFQQTGIETETRINSDHALLEPENGVYFGANINLGVDSIADFNNRLGYNAAVFVQFLPFPFTEQSLIYLDQFMEEMEEHNAIALLTLEPIEGLEAVTTDIVNDLAVRLSNYNHQGVPIMVRFGHEMNGSWYPWGQQPSLYIQKFQLVADALHENTYQTAMIWAPNYGSGYPFCGGKYESKPGDKDFALLDTNGDNQLNQYDDMYAPYYPGDQYVDWVGLSIYHWGNEYPWGENEVPEQNKLLDMLTGNYIGLNGDERSLPDFYEVFVNLHNKPMAITETAALYNTLKVNDQEIEIKSNWINQVFSPDLFLQFPRIKLINWFDVIKNEAEIGGAVIDWSVTFNPEIRNLFVKSLPMDKLIFSEEINLPPLNP